MINGNGLRPNILLNTKDNRVYILELTIGLEINLNNNAERKHLNYLPTVSDLKSLLKTTTYAISFLRYLLFQFVQPTTFPAADINYGASLIYSTFDNRLFSLLFCFLLFCFVLFCSELFYTKHLLFMFLHIM